MVKNLLATALALTSLALPMQEADAPTFGSDVSSFGNNPSCSVEYTGIEKLISRAHDDSALRDMKAHFNKFDSSIERYDSIAANNPFFAEIYSVWRSNGTRLWTPEELYAIFWVESKGDFRANSHSKPEPALGPFQILESSWNSVPPYIEYYPNVYRLKPSTEKAINLLNSMYGQASALYPNWDKLTLNEQKKIVLRTYNTGIGNYQQANWVVDNLSKETQEYVPKIINEMIKNKFDTDSFLSNRFSGKELIF